MHVMCYICKNLHIMETLIVRPWFNKPSSETFHMRAREGFNKDLAALLEQVNENRMYDKKSSADIVHTAVHEYIVKNLKKPVAPALPKKKAGRPKKGVARK
jgi:hypothetical protein